MVAHPVVRVLVALALALVALNGYAEEISGKVVRVADGDTITVLGPGNQQHKIRLMGIDATSTTKSMSKY